ncbi:MAG: site-2 protease family protein, partial [Clostridia bacterium]
MNGKCKFRVSPSFLAVAIVMTLCRQGYFFCLYSFALVLHELSHYFVARRLHMECKEVALSAFGACLYGDFTKADAREQMFIALAGPLANILLLLITVTFWWLLPESFVYTQKFAIANCLIAVTNLIPCYPLDGGKILSGVLSTKYGHIESVKITQKITIVIATVIFSLFVVGFIFGFNTFSIGLFAIFLFLAGMDKLPQRAYTFRNDLQLKGVDRGVEKKVLVYSESA